MVVLFLDGERSACDFDDDWLEVEIGLILCCVGQLKQDFELILLCDEWLQMQDNLILLELVGHNPVNCLVLLIEKGMELQSLWKACIEQL